MNNNETSAKLDSNDWWYETKEKEVSPGIPSFTHQQILNWMPTMGWGCTYGGNSREQKWTSGTKVYGGVEGNVTNESNN